MDADQLWLWLKLIGKACFIWWFIIFMIKKSFSTAKK